MKNAKKQDKTISLKLIEEAAERLTSVAYNTPLQFNKHLSDKYNAKIYLKREDLQEVRSFKIRGAFNKISSLSDNEKKKGVVCASAGNHAQGVAYSCSHLGIKGTIFMPIITPTQKVNKVAKFGGEWVDIKLVGNTFDEAAEESRRFEKQTGATYVHPFNDPLIIAGQATAIKEAYEELDGKIDNVVTCVGGGGLLAGTVSYIKQMDPSIQVYGSEPEHAAGMALALEKGTPTPFPNMDTFVDGAAVKTVGDLTFQIVQEYADGLIKIPEGKVCKTMIDLYQDEGIVAEPAGALAVAALDDLQDKIQGKTVICTLSGGNNDILRYPEILERSLVWQGLKHYFIIEFAQKPGQLRAFLDHALGEHDDIVRFEYVKKTNKEKGPALVGVELQNKNDLEGLEKRMEDIGLNFRRIKPDDMMYHYLV